MRTLVTQRSAVRADAPFLVGLWSESLRKVDREDQVADLEQIIEHAHGSDEHRLVIAEYDGCSAGAVHLAVATLSSINLERTVQALSPHVLPEFRRHGVGRSLMEAAVTFAEELGVGMITTAAAAGSRDANRFLARLALGPQVVVRAAPTTAVRARLTAQRPAGQRGRQLGQVLAARRSLRRSQLPADAG